MVWLSTSILEMAWGRKGCFEMEDSFAIMALFCAVVALVIVITILCSNGINWD